jgi:hypothetical protein
MDRNQRFLHQVLRGVVAVDPSPKESSQLRHEDTQQLMISRRVALKRADHPGPQFQFASDHIDSCHGIRPELAISHTRERFL